MEETRSFGYICPKCGKAVMARRSAFSLAAAAAHIECPCGESDMLIETDGSKFRMWVPCGLCGETHQAECSAEAVLHGRGIGLACPKTRQLCCYIGQEEQVSAQMEQLAAELVAAGADGIVTGALTPEGDLDTAALRPIYAAARRAAREAGRPAACTLHRAFDVCRNPFAALEAAKELQLATILTSGQAANAPQGASLLHQLVQAAGNDIEILVGAGVGPANLPDLAAQTGARAFHLSGKKVLDSRMIFRREGVPMGLPGFSEFDIWQTDEATIREVRTILDTIA